MYQDKGVNNIEGEVKGTSDNTCFCEAGSLMVYPVHTVPAKTTLTSLGHLTGGSPCRMSNLRNDIVPCHLIGHVPFGL